MKMFLPLLTTLLLAPLAALHAAEGPVARWKLDGNSRDAVGMAHGTAAEVDYLPGKPATSPAMFARFNGRGSRITIPAASAPSLGKEDFTLSLWIDTAAELDDDLGDLASQFDSWSRTGFHLSLRQHTGVTHSQPNSRQLQFGLDAGTEPQFTDEGRPGAAVFAQSLAVYRGKLYAGTCESGKDQAGHVYRYDGTGKWTDCGSPDRANSITAMCAGNGELFVGSGKYRLGGSSLAESENPNLGGRIFRYLGEGKWEQIAHFPEMEAVGGMVVYRGRLFVSSLYKPAAFHRHDGGKNWTALPVPNGKRVEALGVFNGHLWATSYDHGNVYRFDGEQWTDLGRVGEPENTQMYAFATYRGQWQVAAWPTGKVFAWENQAWQDRGRLGAELEVMGMLIHNGSFYGGTLPLGQIYRYDGGRTWTLLKQLDTTPDVKYRRVWTMAAHAGRLFASTLPSGKVWSMQTGACVTWDEEFPSGWHHVAAQRVNGKLRLFVDGKLVAASLAADAGGLNLNSDQPWQIGAGTGDFLNGSLADVQVFRRALTDEQIRSLAKR